MAQNFGSQRIVKGGSSGACLSWLTTASDGTSSLNPLDRPLLVNIVSMPPIVVSIPPVSINLTVVSVTQGTSPWVVAGDVSTTIIFPVSAQVFVNNPASSPLNVALAAPVSVTGQVSVFQSTTPWLVEEQGVGSSLNSTSVSLGAGAVFTGGWEDMLNRGAAVITFISDVAAAFNGIQVQWSPNASNADVVESYNMAFVSAGQSIVTQPKGRYMRVVYTNGGTGQGYFRLNTDLKRVPVVPSPLGDVRILDQAGVKKGVIDANLDGDVVQNRLYVDSMAKWLDPTTSLFVVGRGSSLTGAFVDVRAVRGNVSVQGQVSVQNFPTTTSVTGLVSVTGDVSVKSPVSVTGQVSVLNAVSVTQGTSPWVVAGDVSLKSAVSVTGQVSVVGNVSAAVAGNVSAVVTGNVSATVVGAVSVVGQVSIIGNVSVVGQVSVIGPVSVTGQVSVIGKVSTQTERTAFVPLSPGHVSVANSTCLAIAANTSRAGLVLTNKNLTGAGIPVYLGIATIAVLGSGIVLYPNGGTWVMDEMTFSTGSIAAIASAAGVASLSIQEWNKT